MTSISTTEKQKGVGDLPLITNPFFGPPLTHKERLGHIHRQIDHPLLTLDNLDRLNFADGAF